MSKYKLTKKNLEKNLPFAKGLERELLDADTALKNNEIANLTLKKMRWDDLMKILFLLIGGFITFFFTNILETDNHNETTTEILRLKTEMKVLHSDFQKRLNEQTLIINELENQLISHRQLLEK